MRSGTGEQHVQVPEGSEGFLKHPEEVGRADAMHMGPWIGREPTGGGGSTVSPGQC